MKNRYLPYLVNKLGLLSILKIVVYRLKKKYIFPKIFSTGETFLEKKYFINSLSEFPRQRPTGEPLREILSFGWYSSDITSDPPSWNKNILTGRPDDRFHLPWWEIPDFDDAYGDVKGIWELSRFHWLVAMARNAAYTGKAEQINEWLRSWCEANPPYLGPNWKCAQEASLRLINFAISISILEGCFQPSEAVDRFFKIHAERILPSLDYAIAQKNNHAISEAAAIFISACYLSKSNPGLAKTLENKGRALLEKSVSSLILPDGGFSQYSTNYHRLVLDLLTVVEIFRLEHGSEKFTEGYYSKIEKAAEWLSLFVQKDGKVPNIGANDGAYLLSGFGLDYFDCRPTLFLVDMVHDRRSREGSLSWASVLERYPFLSESKPTKKRASQLLKDSGFAVLNRGSFCVYFNIPSYQFRPPQSDILSVDLWMEGQSVFEDAGSYSYQVNSEHAYYAGVASHNTIEFSGGDQMPKFGRFLYARWPKAKDVCYVDDQDHSSASASYVDHNRCTHERTVDISDVVTITDRVRGSFSKAILRWKLSSSGWSMKGGIFYNQSLGLSIEIVSVPESVRTELVRGFSSPTYYLRTKREVIEVEFDSEAEIKTIVRKFA